MSMHKPDTPCLTRRRLLISLAGLSAGLLASCGPRKEQTAGPTHTVESIQEHAATVKEEPTRVVGGESARAVTVERRATAKATSVEAPAPGATVMAAPTRPPAAQPATETPMKRKHIVAIGACDDYGPDRVEAVVRDLVSECGGLDIVGPGSTVVIKPNFTAGGRVPTLDGLPNILTYTTHPDVARAIAVLSREAGAERIILVEGWGPDVWDVNQYRDWIHELGAEVVNLDDPAPAADFSRVEVKDHFELPYVWLHEVIAKADVFISVPKLKCHASAGITIAIKNVFGCTPLPRYRESSTDTSRTTMHKGDWGRRLPRILVDVLRARPIDFSVVDGISTIDQGEGPWNDGTPGINIRTVHPGLLMAGRNPVAVDSVGTAVMGFDPTAGPYEDPFPSGLNHFALAAQVGLGTNRLDEIDVRGLSIEEARFPFTSCPRLASDSVDRMQLAARRAGQHA